MNNKEYLAQSSLPLSPQAQLLIGNLSDDSIDVKAFEEWAKKRLVVGGGMVIEFLQEQQKNLASPANTPTLEREETTT